ncbi:alpha/beta fold hydrolase [Phaeobacter sp. PT47_59]|uniref:alpha/beta hydrolase n=1 Tax=Phaeobacter sp. PT47_59 TaxID=3029979 RepID=UPI002380A1D0|nr:alpha/beta hydrolase [Phaeobacter sp. PT47_59]MDE4174556.1 alpha/beta fold hydrolase [Phaeobacter sp. PT47_59]
MISALVRMAIIGAGVMTALPFVLILSDRPAGGRPADPQAGLDFSGLSAGQSSGSQMPDPTSVAMRDGYDLQVRSYRNGPGPLVVLVHGSGWNGLQYASLAPQIAGHVLVPDLRGHGGAPGRRGDVAYIGQLEDDLADLIAARVEPGQKVVLLGHSSGGGLVVRFAGGDHGAMIDRAVLLAPFLKHNAPTTRKNSGGWARPLTRRIVGLSMLNAVGITRFNHLSAIEFNMPQEVLDGPFGHLATTSYSFRLNTSYAPRGDYLQDIKSLPDFLVIAGEKDEAFVAEGYEALMTPVNPRGRYVTVPNVGHLAIVDAPATALAVKEFLGGI